MLDPMLQRGRNRSTDLHLLIPQLSVIVDEQSVIVVDRDVFDAEVEKIIKITVDKAGIFDLALRNVRLVFTNRFVDVVTAHAGRFVVRVEEGLVITDSLLEGAEVET